MKIDWKKNAAAVIITASMLTSAMPYKVFAEGEPPTVATSASYQMTDIIKAEVKSVINERTSEGTRIGAVVRLQNLGAELTRVPEYEVRVETNSGVTYTLRPSAVNPTVILPEEKVELSYMVVVNRMDTFALSKITWIKVDDYEYPIKETKILSIPVSSLEWKGNNSALTDSVSAKKWGEPFTIPVLSSSLEFSPVSLNKQITEQGPATVVTLLVENKGQMKETVLDFRVDGKTDQKVYEGRRVEKDPIMLEPGEKQYIHYAITMENNVDLKSLNVVTPESFVKADQTKVNYTVGRLNIQLSNDQDVARTGNQPRNGLNYPIQFDPLNKLIPSKVDVSLVELHMHEGEGDGYNTAIAKFKIQNRDERPVPVPNFQAELVGSDGKSYIGARQSVVAQTLTPNLGYVVSYSFNMPVSEEGKLLTMNILDGQTNAPFNIPIASIGAQVQKETDESTLNMYPFKLKLKDWSRADGYNFGAGSSSYSYKIKFDFDIAREENIVVDQNFSKLKVELVDSFGRVLGAENIPFTGEKRLVTGTQTIYFENLRVEQYNSKVTIRLFETIDTPYGEARRLVKTLVQ